MGRFPSLCELADAWEERELLSQRREIDELDFREREKELIARFGSEAETVLEKIRQEVRVFEGNVWLVLQTLNLFGAKMGRQRIIDEFFQAV